VEATRRLQLYRFRRLEVQTQSIAVHARKVFRAKRLSRLIRNCGVIAHGSFQARPREVCVAKGASARFISGARHPGATELSSATLVLDDRPSAFSTDAVNHDLIALPICRASRDLHRSRRHQKETSGKKRQQENQKQNSGMSEETPEQ
jgi:hypothetical protein